MFWGIVGAATEPSRETSCAIGLLTLSIPEQVLISHIIYSLGKYVTIYSIDNSVQLVL